MINFYRRIRRNLLSEGKAGMYLKYAIGEILLVVIGIVIALQIDNWNELRKTRNNETKIYHKIFEDLHSELPSIERKILAFKSQQSNHFHLYNESQGRADFDPIGNYSGLFYVNSFDMFFNDKYSESLSLLTDEEIYERLKVYIKLEKKTKGVFDEWNEYKLQIVRPYLAKHGIKNSKEVFNIKPGDFFLLSTADLISYPKLKEQFGTLELDQILFTLRLKTTWLLHDLKQLRESNRELEVFLKNKLGIVEQHNSATLKALPMLFTEGKTIDEIIDIIRKETPDEPIYDISENEINNLGYHLIDEREFNDAKKVFKLGTELYPNSYNLHDSYGESLFKLQDYDNAIKAFEKALELNPESVSSKKMLEYLRTKDQ